MEASETPLTRRLFTDFRRFGRECLQIDWREIASSKQRARVLSTLRDRIALDRQNPKSEAFDIRVEEREKLPRARTEAEREIGLCRTIRSHLVTVQNVVGFYQVRDALLGLACTREEFVCRLEDLNEILTAEIANAASILPVLREDPRIGFGFCDGPAYDTSMVEAKIAQCRHVRDVELDRFNRVVRFHVWLDA